MFELLTIVFVVLKLTGHIKWSWFWVVSPMWVSMLAWVGLVFAMALTSGSPDALAK